MDNANQSQALATMAKAFEACAFQGDTLKGTIAEGGAIWLAAQALYPGAVWEPAFAQVTFPDGSAIEFIRAPGSLYSTTYKAVPALVKLEAPANSGELVQVARIQKFNPCSNCGALNHGASKYRPVKSEFHANCGNCGTYLTIPAKG